MPLLQRTLLIFLLSAATLSGNDSAPEGEPALRASLRRGRALLVASRQDPASVELAHAYARAHSLPARNLLFLPFKGAVTLSPRLVQEALLDPINQRWRELFPGAECVVLVRGVPYRTGARSVASVVMFGGMHSPPIPHPWYGRSIRFDPGVPLGGQLLRPAGLFTAFTVNDALELLERSAVDLSGKRNDGVFYFCEGAGPRGVRNRSIGKAIQAVREAGGIGRWIDKPNLTAQKRVYAQFTGIAKLDLRGADYKPGAILDNLTSFGGKLLERSGQTSLLSCFQFGVCGGYGTVSEPTNTLTRWADLHVAADYVSGLPLYECYLRRVMDLSLGVVAGDPLMAPFADSATVEVRLKGRDAETPTIEVIADAEDVGGLTEMQVWLDDVSLPTWHARPVLPAGTDCRFGMSLGDRNLVDAGFVLEERRPLPDVLRRFVSADGKGLRILPVGRRADKLLIQTAGVPEANQAFRAEFTLHGEGVDAHATTELTARSSILSAFVIDFEARPPEPGDRLLLRYGGRTLNQVATAGEGVVEFASRLRDGLVASPPFNDPEKWQVEMQTHPETGRTMLLLVTHTPLPDLRGRSLRLHVTRSADSRFLTPGKTDIKPRPISRPARPEGILAPVLTTARLEARLPVPPLLLFPGPHRLVCRTRLADGSVHETHQRFRVDPAPGTCEAILPDSTLDLGGLLRCGLRGPRLPAAEIENLVARLYVNGLLAGSFPPDGDTAVAVECSLPLFGPGENRLQVEWIQLEDLARTDSGQPVPVARSPEYSLFVRRPVAATTQLRTARVQSGKNKITVSGPYLREGMSLRIDDETVPLHRSIAFGLDFTASFEDLWPGEHQVHIAGDATTEKAGAIQTRLRVTVDR